MAHYSSLTLHEAAEILAKYSISGISELIPMSSGISNSNYKVTLTQAAPVLLKISNDKDYNQLVQEQQILLSLASIDFPYSLRPMLTSEGDAVYQHSSFTGVVYPFVQGNIIPPNMQSCFLIGQGLAKLHNDSSSLDFSQIREQRSVGFDSTDISPELNKVLNQDDIFQQCIELLTPIELQDYQEHNHRKSIIHGDLYFDNVLFDDNKLAYILDFEQAGVGDILLDIGISISGCCLVNNELDQKLINSYIEGYQTELSLSGKELELIPISIILGLISISLWRIKRFNINKIDPDKKDNYKELIQIARKYKEGIQ